MAKAVRQYGRAVRDRQGRKLRPGSKVETDLGSFVYRGASEDEDGDTQVHLDPRDQFTMYPGAAGLTVEEEPNGVTLHLMEEEAAVLSFALFSVVADKETQLGGNDVRYWADRLKRAFTEAGVDYLSFYNRVTEFQELSRKSKGVVYLGTERDRSAD